MKKGQDLFNHKDYPNALKAYQDAIIAARECKISSLDATEGIVEITKALNKQKKDAEEGKETALKAQKKLAASNAENENLYIKFHDMYETARDMNDAAFRARNKADSMSEKARSMDSTCRSYVGIYKHHDLAEGFHFANEAYRIDDANVLAKSAIYSCAYGQGESHTLMPYLTLDGIANAKYVSISGDTVVTIDDASLVMWSKNKKELKRLPGKPIRHPDGTRFYMQPLIDPSGYRPPDTITVWDTRTNRVQEKKPVAGNIDFETAAFAPDGRTLITSINYCINLWNIENTWQRIGESCKPGPIERPIISDNGKRVLLRTYITEVADAMTGRITHTLGTEYSNANFNFSPDSRYLAINFQDQNLKLVDLENNENITIPDSGNIQFFQFSPNSMYLLLSSTDSNSSIHLFDLTNRKDTVVYSNINAAATGVVFAPNMKKMIVTLDNETALIGSTSENSFETFSKNVSYAFFSPKSDHILTAWENTLRLWDTGNYRDENTIMFGHTSYINSAGFSADGKRVWASSADKVKLWAIDTIEDNGRIPGAWEKARYSVFFQKTDKVFVLNNDSASVHSVKIPDSSSRTEQYKLKERFSINTVANFSPDGNLVITIDTLQGILKLWNDTGIAICSAKVHDNNALQFRYAADNTKILKLYKSKDKTLKKDTVLLINVSTRQVNYISIDSISTANFSPDNNHVMIIQRNGQISLFNLSGQKDSTYCDSFSKYYSVLFSSNRNKNVQKRTDTIAILAKYTDTTAMLAIVKRDKIADTVKIGKCDTGFFSSDGTYLMTYSKDSKNVGIYNIKTPRTHVSIPTTIQGRSKSLRAFFSPNNEIVIFSDRRLAEILLTDTSLAFPLGSDLKNVTFSTKGAYALFNFKQGCSLVPVPALHDFIIDKKEPVSLELPKADTAIFSPDDKYVLTRYNNTFKLWDISDFTDISRSGYNKSTAKTEELTTIPLGAVKRFSFSKDGKRIFTQYPDGSAKVWIVDIDELLIQMKPKFGN